MFSIRTKEIIKTVEKCDVLADVGCDHGIVSYYLLKNGVCKKAILTDISKKSLDKAKRLIGGKFDAEFLLGDGLEVLNGLEIDVCLICGMGGMEIKDILSKNFAKIKKFILQPMTNITELRGFLVNNNFNIERDYLIFDKKRFYDIIVVTKGKCGLTEEQLYFGKDNLEKLAPEFIGYLKYKKAIAEKILNGASEKSDKFCEIKKYADLIDGILKKDRR